MAGRKESDIHKSLKLKHQERGSWRSLYQIRDGLKGNGMPPHEAWVEADRILMASDDLDNLGGVVSTPAETAVEEPCSSETAVFVDPKTWDGKPEVSQSDEVGWVAEHLVYDPEQMVPGDSPNSAAWGLYLHCKSNQQARSDFWKITYPKFRTELEEESRFADPGTETLRLIDEIVVIRNEVTAQ